MDGTSAVTGVVGFCHSPRLKMRVVRGGSRHCRGECGDVGVWPVLQASSHSAAAVASCGILEEEHPEQFAALIRRERSDSVRSSRWRAVSGSAVEFRNPDVVLRRRRRECNSKAGCRWR